jgi:hypothetical protein
MARRGGRQRDPIREKFWRNRSTRSPIPGSRLSRFPAIISRLMWGADRRNRMICRGPAARPGPLEGPDPIRPERSAGRAPATTVLKLFSAIRTIQTIRIDIGMGTRRATAFSRRARGGRRGPY